MTTLAKKELLACLDSSNYSRDSGVCAHYASLSIKGIVYTSRQYQITFFKAREDITASYTLSQKMLDFMTSHNVVDRSFYYEYGVLAGAILE